MLRWSSSGSINRRLYIIHSQAGLANEAYSWAVPLDLDTSETLVWRLERLVALAT